MLSFTIHGKGDLRQENVETPQPGPGQVRLKVEYVGICGSDIHYYFDGANGDIQVSEPLVPGHELSAEVDLDPTGEFPAGTPVVVHPARFGQPTDTLAGRPHLWPGGSYLGSASTKPHTQGAMREYLVVEKGQLRTLPDDLPLQRAALAEPLAVGLHALNRAGAVDQRDVLICGGGPIGLLAARAAVIAGARVAVTDLLAGPLTRARELGVAEAIDVSTTPLESNRYDVVLECTGARAGLQSALAAVRVGGTIVQVGNLPNRALELNLAAMTGKEISYLGTLRFNDEIDQAVALLAGDPSFEKVVTHVLPANELSGAFDTAKDSAVSGKVLIAMQQ